MPLIEWDQTYAVGVAEFDGHHRHLVGLINRVYDDFTTEAPVEMIGQVFDELISYTGYHFGAEESWMREQNYYKTAEHIHEHERFTARITEMMAEYRGGQHNVALDMILFLRNWLMDHILKTDAEYGCFVATKGVPLAMI